MNKKIFILIVSLLFPIFLYSQCREFTHNNAIPLLKEFLLSGRYHSLELEEGEEILIYKTINKGILYRFIVISSENLPQPHFIIADWNDNVIYDNANNNLNPIFDYECQKTQRIKIWIKIPKKNHNPQEEPAKGCVSLVVGIKKI